MTARADSVTGARRTAALWPPLAFLALAAAMTWPQAAQLASGVSPGTDSLLHAWILAWNARALATDPLGVWSPPIFYPYDGALAFTDNHLALSLVTAPLIWAGAAPVLAYNILVLLSYALAGLAVYHLVADLLAGEPGGAPAAPEARLAALIAGAAFAFCAFRMAHYFHLQLLQTAWLTWALLLMRRVLYGRAPLARHALLLGLLAGLQGVTALYYLPFTALALGLYAGLWALGALWRRARGGQPLPWRRAGLLLLAGLAAAAIAVPLTLPYARVYRTLGVVRAPSEIDNWSAPLQAYLAVDQGNRLYGALGGIFGARGGENALAPGLAVLLLAALGLAHAATLRLRQRPAPGADRRYWALLALAALLLSLGTGVRWERGDAPLPVPMPYTILYQYVPGLAALRVPARWGMLVSLAACVLAGLGAARLLALVPQRAARNSRPAASHAVLGGALLALVLAERLSAPVALVEAPGAAGAPPVYAWLAAPEQRDIRVVLELPVGRTPRGAELDRIARRQLYQTIHWKTLPVSYSGVIPFGTTDLMARSQRLPDDDTLRYLAMVGVDTLVVHRAEVEPAGLPALLAGLDATPLLRRRADVGEATVYALQPAADVAGPDAPGAAVYVSADERMPGPPVIGLLRRWRAAGHALYGPGRVRYYAPLAEARPGQVFDYGLLAAEEDPLAHGFARAGLRWASNGLALYARDPALRASIPLGQQAPGRFHPAYPAAVTVALAPQEARAGDMRATWDAPLAEAWVQLDVASVRAQRLAAGAGAVEVPAGASTVTLRARTGETLRVSGDPAGTAILRARVLASAPAPEPEPGGLAVAAEATFEGSLLRVAVRAGGAGELLVQARGAAAADERPIRLLEGIQPAPPGGGEWSFAVDLLRPAAPWLTEAGEPQDGRYIVYLKLAGAPGDVGVPIAKFNIRGGALADAEPVPLPLTAVR